VASIKLGRREIGPSHPCLIIGEAGVNHNGDPKVAHALIDALADCGADVVKFQSFRAGALASAGAPKAGYQLATTDASESQLEMLRRLELPARLYPELMEHCRQRGVQFLCSPFDEASADLLAGLPVPAFKVPSGELNNPALLAHIARKGLPMIVSTGMATLGEVEAALETIATAGDPPVALLHCVSNYPAKPEQTNLRAMATMTAAFGVPVGYSDHTLGDEIPLAAVALGACILEKHFTLDRALPGPDHQASAEPAEFAAMVQRLRRAEAALGDGRKRPTSAEFETRAVARKSLAAAARIGTGLEPRLAGQVIGRRTRRAIAEGELLAWEMLD
jgi:N,N'-diacetyllegionaminate synthase